MCGAASLRARVWWIPWGYRNMNHLKTTSFFQVSPCACSLAGAFPWSGWCRCWQFTCMPGRLTGGALAGWGACWWLPWCWCGGKVSLPQDAPSSSQNSCHRWQKIQAVQQHTQNRCSLGVFLIGGKYYDILEAPDRDVPGEICVPCCCWECPINDRHRLTTLPRGGEEVSP